MGETTISYLISAYQAMLPPALKSGGSKTAKKKYKNIYRSHLIIILLKII